MIRIAIETPRDAVVELPRDTFLVVEYPEGECRGTRFEVADKLAEAGYVVEILP